MFRREGNRSELLSIGIAFAASLMLSELGFGPLVFCIPVLLLSPRLSKKVYGSLVCCVLAVCISVIQIIRHRGSGSELSVLLLGILFPLACCIGCAVWIWLKDFSDNVMRKLVICSYFTASLGLLFVIWVLSPYGANQTDYLVASFSKLLTPEILGSASETFVKLIVSVVLLMTVPFCMIFSGIQIIISEFVLHRTDDDWQCSFAYMKMPNSYVWFFLVAWIVALGSELVDFVPMWVSVIGWNLAAGVSLHYMLGGVSIITSLLRRRSATVTASKVFVPLMIGTIIPGVNLVVIPGLVILGVLENWIKFR